jgi:hypothetical protein
MAKGGRGDLVFPGTRFKFGAASVGVGVAARA